MDRDGKGEGEKKRRTQWFSSLICSPIASLTPPPSSHRQENNVYVIKWREKVLRKYIAMPQRFSRIKPQNPMFLL